MGAGPLTRPSAGRQAVEIAGPVTLHHEPTAEAVGYDESPRGAALLIHKASIWPLVISLQRPSRSR